MAKLSLASQFAHPEGQEHDKLRLFSFNKHKTFFQMARRLSGGQQKQAAASIKNE